MGIFSKLNIFKRIELAESAARRAQETQKYLIAENNRLTSLMHGRAQTASADELITAKGAKLRAIARLLVRNYPEAAAAIDFLAAKLVGPDGIWPRFDTGRPRLDEKLNGAFFEWSLACDVSGEECWADVLKLWVREMLIAGEAICEIGTLAGGGGFVLNPIEPEQLAGYAPKYAKNLTNVDGVLFDENGRKVSFLVIPHDPAHLYTATIDPVEIPAARVLHIFEKCRPSQHRGVTIFDAAGINLHDLSDAAYAILQNLRAAGRHGLWVEKPQYGGMNSFSGNFDPSEQLSGDAARNTAPSEPGMWNTLNPGEKLHNLVYNGPAPQAEAFVMGLKRAIAARVGVPYAVLAGDPSGMNYSTSRAEEMHYRVRWQANQWIIARKGIRPLLTRWLEWAIITGRVAVPAAMTVAEICNNIRYEFPPWPWVDVRAEAAARELRAKTGTLTWSGALQEDTNRGLEDYCAEVQKEIETSERTGVPIPSIYPYSPNYQREEEPEAATVEEVEPSDATPETPPAAEAKG